MILLSLYNFRNKINNPNYAIGKFQQAATICSLIQQPSLSRLAPQVPKSIRTRAVDAAVPVGAVYVVI